MLQNTPRFPARLAALLLALLALTTACQKDDDSLTPARDFSSLTNFDKLRIGSGFRTTVRQGTSRQVRIAAPGPDQDNLRVSESNGTLVVEIRNKASNTAGTVDITMPALAGLEFSGGVEATVTGFSPAALPVAQSGGGSLTITGSVQALTLDLSGGARFNGYDCPATDAVVTLSGGSVARVAAANTLRVTASGGSSLFYKGAATVSQTLSGGSTVTRE